MAAGISQRPLTPHRVAHPEGKIEQSPSAGRPTQKTSGPGLLASPLPHSGRSSGSIRRVVCAHRCNPHGNRTCGRSLVFLVLHILLHSLAPVSRLVLLCIFKFCRCHTCIATSICLRACASVRSAQLFCKTLIKLQAPWLFRLKFLSSALRRRSWAVARHGAWWESAMVAASVAAAVRVRVRHLLVLPREPVQEASAADTR